MDELLTVSSTRRLKVDNSQPMLDLRPSHDSTNNAGEIETADDVLEVLQSKPSLARLALCLQWLTTQSSTPDGFNIRIPGAKAARLVFFLVNDALAHFWPILKNDPTIDELKPKEDFIACLASVAGIGALASRLRILAQYLKDGTKANSSIDKRPAESFHLLDTLEFLQAVIEGDHFILGALQDLSQGISKPVLRDAAWKELITWLATGKLVTVAVEASSTDSWITLKDRDGLWVLDGPRYSNWLGRNIVALENVGRSLEEDAPKMIGQLFSRSISLGYLGLSAIWSQVLCC